MPLTAAAETRRRIPSSILENQLLQAPHKPAALYQVVGWVWSSLVYGATAETTADVGAPPTPSAAAAGTDRATFSPATPSASAGVQWEGQTLSLQPSLNASAASPLRAAVASSGGVSGPTESATPYLEHTLAGRATSSGMVGLSDGEEIGNRSLCTNFDATLTTATDTGNSIITTMTTSTAMSSTAEWPLTVPAQPVPSAQLSPLVLRLLLWWAVRPLLPPLHGTDIGSPNDAWTPSRGSTNGSSGSSSNEEYVPAQQRRQRAAAESQQLRQRIVEIFGLLCERGFGVVVSDALLYGRCHDASEAAAARCNLVFSSYSDTTWLAATSAPVATATAAVPIPVTGGTISGVGVDVDANGAGGVGELTTRYSLNRLLRALLLLHTTPHHAASFAATSSDADATAAGQLLRSLLHCPRLHKRVMRLFDRDGPSSKATKLVFGNAPSATLVSCSPGNSSNLGASRQILLTQLGVVADADDECNDGVRLQFFLPALTHPSPVISSEAWHTLGVLLFSSATMSRATRALLLRTPECPVQHLLASTLALSGDDSDDESDATTQLDGAPPTPLPLRQLRQPSHPMARNSALRILHVLCVSKDVPPAPQLRFTQCPALLWRVLRLAAELCRGNPVANMALVRQVLADYVMSAVRLTTAVGTTMAATTTTFTPTQQLLRDNREALNLLFSSTYTLWGMRDGAGLTSTENGGDYAEAATDAVSDEEDLQRALEMLRE